MTLKRRLDSNWKSIHIINDNGEDVRSFELDRYGKLVNKFEKKTPRNIKLLMTNTLQKPIPNTTKPFVLPQISPQPLPTPVLHSQTPRQNNLKLPQINLTSPNPMPDDYSSEDEYNNITNVSFNNDESQNGFFIEDSDLLFNNDPFDNFDFFEISVDDTNFLF